MSPDPVRQRQRLEEAAEEQLGAAVLAVGLVHPAGASEAPEFGRVDRSKRALADAISWKGLNALMAVTADRVVLFKLNWTAKKMKGQVAVWDHSDLRVTVEPRLKTTDIFLEVLSTGKRLELEGDAKRDQPLFEELRALAKSSAVQSTVEFDVEGKVTKVDVPVGQWTFERRGQNRYRTQHAPTLLQATELLKAVRSVPELMYYIVETPDGALGRDIDGFYTEAPIKTSGLALAMSSPASDTVESVSLTAYGDAMSGQASVALSKSQGRYGNLVLLMECGHCGYKSPVETQPGAMERQCYCCGAMNETSRATITVMFGSSMVDI